jgi:hypothetical protein
MLSSWEKIVQMVLPMGTKWENILTTIDEVGKKMGCGLTSLSKLKLKNYQFTKYILKRPKDKFARCTACEKYKGLQDAHSIGTESCRNIEHVHN